ncbi:hypothetical protein A2U01_0046581, partial [Trifolium medium]|nr:hypothetical protein [Trifolium medium]
EMTSATARLRQAKNAKKKAAAVLGTSSSIPSGTPSGHVSPAPSLEIIKEKRRRDEELEEVSSRKNQRVETAGGVAAGLHRLTPGQPADDFVLPPAFGHTPLFDGHTKVLVSDAERMILEDMGPASIRSEIANSSAAVFRLLEVVTFLNG